MIEKDNIIYFDNDNEFYEFCVDPLLINVPDETNPECYYTTFNFRDVYLDALKNNKKFAIKDEDSKIYKHNAVSYRTITKPVTNLVPWYNFPKNTNV